MDNGLKAAAAAGALTAAAVAARIMYECRTFKTEYYEISSGRVPESFDGFRMVMITDLHNHLFEEGNESLLAEIRKNSPDIVVMAGDICNAFPGVDNTPAASFVKELCRDFEVYMGNGNHEQRLTLYPEEYGDMGERWYRDISDPHLHILRNDHADITRDGEKIRIYGLEMDRIFYTRYKHVPMPVRYLDMALGKKADDMYSILIAHDPSYFGRYAKWGADLVLSGHIHGGVVQLPLIGGVISPQVTFFPKYSSGLYTAGSSSMVVSRGLYMHKIRIRLNNIPEISCITLRRN
ncbi:MAG: metallophosphoesterase [Lachnospiraceae bacterium]|nr:metallophosphoesterase [Lachnospiraceae bacterium]